jgi:hypothetical protein
MTLQYSFRHGVGGAVAQPLALRHLLSPKYLVSAVWTAESDAPRAPISGEAEQMDRMVR